ncbi:MAG: FKBP-type peptidyl-prolyl cis-trans isomerase [Thaumarchaeota archaeon]|nr:FKBP-type peptidyl-prolyl cis-trans isomerase [Nitrososphaerota archaeon]
MTLEKGTLIFANYTAKVKDTGEAIETTVEDEAKKLKIYDATRKYEPRLVAVGEGWLISGLDDEVKDLEVGQRREIELSPGKAYGVRDPTQTRMVPLRKFGERERELEVGDSVELDNRVGIVRFIGSGRAQVDFNHRLAGKSIVYDFEVMKKLESDQDKLRALIDRRLGGEGGKVTFELGPKTLDVVIPEDLFLLEGLQIIKRGISNDVFKFIPMVAELTFVEKFVNEKAQERKEEVAPEKTEAPAEPAPKPRRKKAAPASPA